MLAMKPFYSCFLPGHTRACQPGKSSPEDWRWWRRWNRGRRGRGDAVEQTLRQASVAASKGFQALNACLHRACFIGHLLEPTRLSNCVSKKINLTCNWISAKSLPFASLTPARYLSFSPVGFHPGLVRVKWSKDISVLPCSACVYWFVFGACSASGAT